ncbi:MAG TPA: hypothetical protein VF263_14585, partial [Longimicrobiaceae bacterium]
MTLAQTAHQITVSSPLGEDVLVVRDFHGEERISGLFHFSVSMVSEDAALSFDDVVGQGLTVVPYFPLADAEIREIVELKLAEVQRRFWE